MPISPACRLVAGDTVRLLGTVAFVASPGEANIYVIVGDKYGPTVGIPRTELDLVTTLIQVGDRVRRTDAPDEPTSEWGIGTVIALVGDRAWVDWAEAGGGRVHALRDLRRVCTVPEQPTPVAATGETEN